MSRSSFAVIFIAGALLAAPARGQTTAPPHWKVAADGPVKMINTEVVSDTTLWFTSMAPGWHVTMGPGGLLYDPRYFAEGRFDAEFEFFIFPNASNEEIGMFLGGTNLDSPAKAYTAFVVRRDGAAAVVRRDGGRETLIHPWTVTSAVRKPETDGKNLVRVAMDSAGVHFLVNGTRIGTWPRSQLLVDGAVGFRVGKHVNLHATRLDITHRLAPVPRGK